MAEVQIQRKKTIGGIEYSAWEVGTIFSHGTQTTFEVDGVKVRYGKITTRTHPELDELEGGSQERIELAQKVMQEDETEAMQAILKEYPELREVQHIANYGGDLTYIPA